MRRENISDIIAFLAVAREQAQDQRGLTDLVEHNVAFREVVQRVPLDEPSRLALISRGTVSVVAPDFFRSSGVRAFFEAVREEYDLVIIDSPPMLHVAYASLLVRYADRTVAVVRHHGPVAPAEELADRLDYLETEVLGYVYNAAPLRDDMAGSSGSLDDVLGKKR
jgi:Mrp family chromosome partitioning ATPase